jgi:hypothetical protein
MAPAIHDRGLGILLPHASGVSYRVSESRVSSQVFSLCLLFSCVCAFGRIIYNSFSTFVLNCVFFSKKELI